MIKEHCYENKKLHRLSDKHDKIKDQQVLLQSEFWILLDEVNLWIVVGKRCVW